MLRVNNLPPDINFIIFVVIAGEKTKIKYLTLLKRDPRSQ